MIYLAPRQIAHSITKTWSTKSLPYVAALLIFALILTASAPIGGASAADNRAGGDGPALAGSHGNDGDRRAGGGRFQSQVNIARVIDGAAMTPGEMIIKLTTTPTAGLWEEIYRQTGAGSAPRCCRAS